MKTNEQKATKWRFTNVFYVPFFQDKKEFENFWQQLKKSGEENNGN